MNFDDIYGSKFLKGTDIPPGRRVALRIASVELSYIKGNSGADEPQLVLHFANTQKILGLNMTNANRIKDMYGDLWQTNWPGQTIEVYQEIVNSFGEQKPTVRVWSHGPQPTATQPVQASPPPPVATPATPAPTPGPLAQSFEQQAAAPAPAAPPPAHPTSPAADPFGAVGQPPPDSAPADDFDDDIPF